jgi:hypothetical protein
MFQISFRRVNPLISSAVVSSAPLLAGELILYLPVRIILFVVPVVETNFQSTDILHQAREHVKSTPIATEGETSSPARHGDLWECMALTTCCRAAKIATTVVP